MTTVGLPKFKLISILIALTLTFSLASASPAGRGSKSKKASARSVKKSGKSKANARGSKVSARSRSSRSDKLSARNSRRGKKGRNLSARGRGRSHRSRWRSQVASTSSHHSTGVHNFLTREWTKAQTPIERTLPDADSETPSLSATGTEVPNYASVETGVHSVSDAARARMPGEASEEIVPINPLVAAYTDSLAARGFGADNQGFIITSLKGEVLAEHNADRLFNPASVTKIATSLTAISRLGPDFRFRTALYTDGALDPETGILHGSLYLIGS